MAEAFGEDVARAIRDWFVPAGQADAERAFEAYVGALLERLREDPRVSTPDSLEDMVPRFANVQIGEAPESLEGYFFAVSHLVEQAINVAAPTFIGHMTSALPAFVRPLSRLVAGLNQNLVKVETSKAFTLLERQVIAKLHRLVFEREGDFYADHVQARSSTLGIFTSGGTLANLTALWAARNRALGPAADAAGVAEVGLAVALRNRGFDRAVVIASSLAHYSFDKAVDILGFGTSGLVRVPVDPAGRVRPSDVRQAVADARAERALVVAIVGVAGTTDCGSVDPLRELADVAEQAGCHFHVDAAWGGPTLFSDAHRSKVDGIALADSVTIDGHKQMYLPMGIGASLFRDPSLALSIEKSADYIIRANSADLGRRSLEGSRAAMAIYVDVGLHVFGRDGYARLVDRGVEFARLFARLVSERAEFELVGYPELNIVNYRFIPEHLRNRAALTRAENDEVSQLNERLQQAQMHAGRTFVSRTTLRHTSHGVGVPVVVLRAVLANPITEEAHLCAVLDDQVALAQQL